MRLKRNWGLLGMNYNSYNLQEDVIITNELDSTCGISDEELTYRFKESIRIDNEIRKINNLPTARYDAQLRKVYLEYPDGSCVYC